MKRIIKIYRFVFKYPGYFGLGILFMLLYAAFSGVSITLAIPVFDNIFSPDRATEILFTNYLDFYHSFTLLIKSFIAENGVPFSEQLVSELWVQLKELFSQTNPWLLLQIISAMLIILIILKNLFYFLNRMMFVNLRGRVIKDLRNACYRKYLSLSYAFFNHNRVGDSIVRMVNDIEFVNRLFIDSIYKMMRDLIVVFAYAFIAFKLNPKLFLISIVILPAFAFSANYLSKKVRKYSKRIQSQLSTMFSNIEEVLNSMRIVKAFCKEDYEYNKLEQINHKYFKFWRKSEVYTSFAVPIAEISSILIGIVILFIGGAEILNSSNSFSLGNFMAFLFAIFSMMHPLKGVAHDLTDLRKGLVSVDRVNEILEFSTEIVEATDPISKKDFSTSIEMKNVSFEYVADTPVISGCNITIHKGQKIAFVGASGSGKTTIANLINRMYDVTDGEILIDGIPIKSIKINEFRKLFGIVTQESILFSESLENNIKYGSLESKTLDDVKQACRFAYADEFIDKLADGYQTIILPHGSNLSGGQKQRLCIARAIIDNPPILIFDEATSALDTDSEQKVQKAIDMATGNRTVIVIAHRLSTILSADKIYVLDKGKVVGEGKHDELLKSCPEYKHFFDLQFNH